MDCWSTVSPLFIGSYRVPQGKVFLAGPFLACFVAALFFAGWIDIVDAPREQFEYEQHKKYDGHVNNEDQQRIAGHLYPLFPVARLIAEYCRDVWPDGILA